MFMSGMGHQREYGTSVRRPHPQADIVEFEPVALRRQGRVGLRQESDCDSKGQPETGCGQALERVVLQCHSLRQDTGSELLR